MRSYVVKTEKNKLLRTGFEPGSRYPRHSAICELSLFASISHVILILLLNLSSLIRLSLSKADRRSEKKIDRSFRERERTKYSSYFCWGIYFKKFLLGTWKYVFEKIWYSCSIFLSFFKWCHFYQLCTKLKISNQLICIKINYYRSNARWIISLRRLRTSM